MTANREQARFPINPIARQLPFPLARRAPVPIIRLEGNIVGVRLSRDRIAPPIRKTFAGVSIELTIEALYFEAIEPSGWPV